MNFILRIKGVINRVVRCTNWYKQKWGGADKIYKLNTFGLQVVNTGSGSGVHDFCYDGLPLKCFNFALGPQSLLHDFNILKNYFSYFSKGCVILIPICPFSGMVVKYDKVHNFKYYPMLHPATIIEFDEKERNRAYMLYKDPFGTMPLKCIKNTFVEVVKRLLKIFTVNKCKLSLKQSAETVLNGWKKQFSIKDLSDIISESHNQDIQQRKGTVGEILDFCLERGYKPVLVVPPIHISLHSYFPHSFEEQYMSPLLDEALKRNVTCLNYMRDNRFSFDHFYDTSLFLNNEGSKIFTKQVLVDLKLI